jgi:hypothetical protein
MENNSTSDQKTADDIPIEEIICQLHLQTKGNAKVNNAVIHDALNSSMIYNSTDNFAYCVISEFELAEYR